MSKVCAVGGDAGYDGNVMNRINTCDGCGQVADTTGAIIDGRFGQYCRNCRSKLRRLSLGGNAQHYRDKDRSDNARDLIQPWDSRGAPNRDFIQNYPEEARNMFTEDELKRYG